LIDPLERWRQYGGKPDYAGLLTFGGLPYTEDPAKLEGMDIAVVGAPTDDLVSDRPGTRFGPRAIRAASCPPGQHLEAKIDAFAELKMVDFGDAPVLPADAARSHHAIEATVSQVLTAAAIPIVLGGDHSIAESDIRACAAAHGPVGLVHFDTHTDTGTQVFGVEVSHGTPMYRLVEAGSVDPKRYVQIGLRGYWPGPAEFEWQASKGSRASSPTTSAGSASSRSSSRRLGSSVRAPHSSRSTSTCSTQPTLQGQALRSRVGSLRTSSSGPREPSPQDSTSSAPTSSK
jgi:arginase family enzyme